MDEIKYKGYDIKIEQDTEPMNPRTDWDNLGNMICWHDRYTLGDESLLGNFSSTHEVSFRDITDYCSGWDEVLTELKKENDIALVFPLYLYDHSIQSIKIGSFVGKAIHAEWDSGQIGFAYVTKAEIKNVFSVKRISRKTLARAEEILRGEVETYDSYIRGDVSSFVIEKEGEHIDSCSGYYGDDEYCMQEAKNSVDCTVKNNIKEHIQRLKKYIQNKVGLLHRQPLTI